MSADGDAALMARYAAMTDEALREIIAQARDYRPEAVNAARAVLLSRGSSAVDVHAADRPIESPTRAASELAARVVLADVDVPFWRVVFVLVKVAIASIPAAIILWLLGMLLVSLTAHVFSSVVF
jgi:hypothetical protein